MFKRVFFGASAMIAAAVVGCYAGGQVDPVGGGSGTEGGSSSNPSDASTTSSDNGLPCDVEDLLEKHCAACHGATLSGGAPNHLVTASDLAAPAKSDPSKSQAAYALMRMRSQSSPMPPSGNLPAADIAVLEAWVNAGMPAGSCASGDTPVTPPTNSPLVCTSKTTWTSGDYGSQRMHPGRECIACHAARREGPAFAMAGTVYPTAHEPDNCNGLNGRSTPTQVVITDATGKTFTAAVNDVGNFMLGGTIAKPYSAKVVSGTKVREMKGKQTTGDCNGCHTEQGASNASGRIMAP